jgi:hypothetical protein
MVSDGQIAGRERADEGDEGSRERSLARGRGRISSYPSLPARHTPSHD